MAHSRTSLVLFKYMYTVLQLFDIFNAQNIETPRKIEEVDRKNKEMKDNLDEFRETSKDGVWGTEFNRDKQGLKTNTDHSLQSQSDEKEADASNFMHKLSSKMFEMAKRDKTVTKKNMAKFKPATNKPVEDIPEDSFTVKGSIFSNLKIKNTTIKRTELNEQRDVDVTKKYSMKTKQRFSISVNGKSEAREESEGHDSSLMTPQQREKRLVKSVDDFDEVDGLSCSVFDSEITKTLVSKNKERQNENSFLGNYCPSPKIKKVSKDFEDSNYYLSPKVQKASKDHDEDGKNVSMDESMEFRDVKWDNETTDVVVCESKKSDNSFSKMDNSQRKSKRSEKVRNNSDEISEHNDKPKLSEIQVSENEDVPIIPKQRKKRKTTDTDTQSKKRKLENGDAVDVSYFIQI